MLVPSLDADLDNIVLMAMRKEQERRYQSVDQLAEDREPLLISDRLPRRDTVVPLDSEATGVARAREPPQERTDAATHPGSGGDPLIDEVLA